VRETYNFINRIISEFGPLTTPITIRRGKGTSSNSGLYPEYAPADQPASRYAEESIMRKQDVFPKTHYNAKDLLSSGPALLTIDYAAMEPVGEGVNQQEKLVAHFKEPDAKLLVVTSTKFDAIALIAKNDDSDNWPGTKIVLETGKVSFQGKLVDGISIRAPRKTASKKPPPVDEAEFDDEI
jgi:hypothetical protein